MRNLITIMSVLMAVLAGVAVVYLRYEVHEQTVSLQKMVRQIERDKKAIHVLHTEISYLTSPSKLQDMSLQYLAMMPPQPEQIVSSITDVPYRAQGVNVAVAKQIAFQKRYQKSTESEKGDL